MMTQKTMIVQKIKYQKQIVIVTIDQYDYEIEPILVLKYHLKENECLNKEDFDQMINENLVYYYDRLAIKKMKKMMTRQQLNTYLIEQNAPYDIINHLMKQYIEKHYIDDFEYAKIFIEQKKEQYGPLKIKAILSERGLSDKLIQAALYQYKSNHILESLVKKRITKMKHQNKQKSMYALKSYFLNKGYEIEDIERVIFKNQHLIQIDEKAYQKAYDKEYERLKRKDPSGNLDRQIKENLFNKGYRK